MIHPYSHYVKRAGARWPDKLAIIDGNASFTYAELDRRVGQLAAGFRSLNLERGDRVAILQENNHRYVEAVCAVARAGGVFVPMLGALGEKEHRHIVTDAGARIAVALSPEGGIRAQRLRDAMPELVVVGPGDAEHDYEALLDSHRSLDLQLEGKPGDLAQILYTSGTTGKPKGVMHSFGSTNAAMAAWVSRLGSRHDDRPLEWRLQHSTAGDRRRHRCAARREGVLRGWSPGPQVGRSGQSRGHRGRPD